jgi:hypothetical protein
MADNLKQVVPFLLWDTRLSDPDGYRPHFASPADAPEETKLSEWSAQRPVRDGALT